MRAFFELVEANRLFLKADELAALDVSLLRALRRAGIMRDGDPGMVDVSIPDLCRVIRSLWGVLGRGLPVPAAPDARALLLGWMPDGVGERDVYLVPMAPRGLRQALHSSRRALVLVPTARAVTPEMRARHGPGALVVVEALEEALQAKDGRLVRAGAVVQDVVEDEARPVSSRTATGGALQDAVEERRATGGREKATAGSERVTGVRKKSTTGARPAGARAVQANLAGARRWNEIRICLVNLRLVRVDLPDRSVRCTPQDMGMAHGTRRTPTLVWAAFVVLCEGEGYFRTRRFGTPEATTKLVSRLRAALRAAFGMRASPFHRYSSEHGWKSRFQARGSLPDATTDRWLDREPE